MTRHNKVQFVNIRYELGLMHVFKQCINLCQLINIRLLKINVCL